MIRIYLILVLAMATIVYALIQPRRLDFNERWEPVKFIVPFHRAA